MWNCDPFMNGNELDTIGLNMDIILELFWTNTMALVGLSNGIDGGIGLGLYLWIEHVPWTFYELDRTLLA